ncbi:glutathione synthetase ATP-binding domain-like protein [Aspergillus japonicus CBS 114.51]|uniref:Glutathione synthetase ATP-binding domain-like protein n=1 Tax=Aspergillus japonicus CBS 114.51 TaxID=1448312 RepID=A0A8T8WZK8_ASPJA|nr:glutathione synthetase ATP-binding domain-like protein [Aspergillus japonicus CBS 114.51]RAH81283.1 glutathione synthetase ATP-binding domain-like protein [Aspergillus japonicus CBS 114.51]
MTLTPITIAFFYETISLYLSKGYSLEECLELDKDEAIDSMIESLRGLGYRVIPVGDMEEMIQRIAKGEHQGWDLGFSISEGMHGAAREAQIPGVLEAYRIPCVFSDAATLTMTLDKAKTKVFSHHAPTMMFQYHKIATAPFAVVSPTSQNALIDVQASPHAVELTAYPLFIKPSCEGSSKGIYPFSKVHNQTELEQGVQKLQRQFPGQSILIESYLAGREYSVSLIGTGPTARVLGTLHLDWEAAQKRHRTQSESAEDPFTRGFLDVDAKNRANDKDIMKFAIDSRDPEVAAVEALALRVWRVMGFRDVGRVDIRCSADGIPHVIEVNPLPGLCPGYSFLSETARHHGVSHQKLLALVVESAVERYPNLARRSLELKQGGFKAKAQ